MPWARWESLVWDPPGMGRELDSRIALMGASPTIAPGSARMTSARLAKLAYAWPVAGLARTVMSGRPFSWSWLAAITVLAICMRDRTPSCTRAPPLVTTVTTGRRRLAACSMARATFSPTTQPMLPPMKPKSRTAITAGLPPMEQAPVTTASVRPVRRWSRKIRCLYDTLEEKDSGSRDVTLRFVSRNVPGSARESIRSRAVML